MEADRRQALRLAGFGLGLSAIAPLFSPLLAYGPQKAQLVALLVPLTGSSAALGTSLQRAATLAQPAAAGNAQLLVLDTAGTPAGAAAAANMAMRRGARIILGPLFAAEVAPVVKATAGRVPVLSFSNDAALAGSGAFLLGVTASQMVTALLGYARGRGVKTIALFGDSAWSAQAFDAARRVQAELGLTLSPVATGTTPATLLAALRGAGELPDALLAPDNATLLAVAQALRGSDVQLLATGQALDYAPASLALLDGAWLAAPDPAGFADFARAYETAYATPPGAIATLAYDGTTIANAVRAAGPISREALLAPAGFPGIDGALHFRADGGCSRSLAILVAAPDGYGVTDHRVGP